MSVIKLVSESFFVSNNTSFLFHASEGILGGISVNIGACFG